jgi:hypothetical protein
LSVYVLGNRLEAKIIVGESSVLDGYLKFFPIVELEVIDSRMFIMQVSSLVQFLYYYLSLLSTVSILTTK